MKKFFTLIISAILLTAVNAMAQFPYNLTTTTGQTFTHLTGATNLTSGMVWDDEYMNLPLPFPVNIAGRITSNLDLELGMGALLTDTQNIVNGLFFTDGDIVDRGQVSSIPSSPVQYQTTGTAPNRIFKFEIMNAGFYDDPNNRDSLNLQIWFYETGSIIEYHYGRSSIADPQSIYQIGNGPLNGFVINLDYINETADKLYTLAGNPSSPHIDSINISTFTGNVLSTTPNAGVVYRFTPKVASGVGSLAQITKVAIYPTTPRETLNVNYEEEKASQYTVIGIDGKATGLKGTLQKGINKVDVSNLPSGMYLIKAANTTSTGSWRFMKM